jgi:hypothetical protein
LPGHDDGGTRGGRDHGGTRGDQDRAAG